MDYNIKHVANPVFAAVRGAALYARRRQEVPFGCVEPEHCKEDRLHQLEIDLVKEELR